MNCSICKSEILAGRQSYILRIELFAAPEQPEIGPEEPGKDRRGEFEKLIEQLEAMDAETVQEEADKVFERHVFVLCPICRARFHGLLRDVRTAGQESSRTPPSGK